MTGLAYSLYVDESGDRGLTRPDPSYPVLALCGLIVGDQAYRESVLPAVDTFKVHWFGAATVSLHYSAIMKRSGSYSALGDPARMAAFEAAFSELISSLPLKIAAAVIHKSEYLQKFGTTGPVDPFLPLDLYTLGMDFVVERFVAFLEQVEGHAGSFIVEARAGGARKEDLQLRAHYDDLRSRGTQFYSAERFSLLPQEIIFKTKPDGVAGLQLADMCAPVIASRTLRPEHEARPLWRTVSEKIWLRGDDAPGGVGLKTYPSALGRVIMGVPLKAPESP